MEIPNVIKCWIFENTIKILENLSWNFIILAKIVIFPEDDFEQNFL